MSWFLNIRRAERCRIMMISLERKEGERGREEERRATVLVMIRQGKKNIKEKSKVKSRVRTIYISIRLTSWLRRICKSKNWEYFTSFMDDWSMDARVNLARTGLANILINYMNATCSNKSVCRYKEGEQTIAEVARGLRGNIRYHLHFAKFFCLYGENTRTYKLTVQEFSDMFLPTISCSGNSVDINHI